MPKKLKAPQRPDEVYSLWLIPTRTDKKWLQSLIDRYAGQWQTPQFTPHLTLYSPFFPPLEKLIYKLEKFAWNQQSITLRIKEPDTRNSYHQSLFLEMENNEFLSRARGVLCAFMPELDPGSFLPHVSLIYGLTFENEALPGVELPAAKDSIQFNQFALVSTQGEVNEWEVVWKSQQLL